MAEVFDLVDRDPSTRLVLDVRFNGGGNEAILAPFIDAIKARQSLNTKGRLFVIIGRGTYSSALQNAITLRQETNAILVGEPTGGKPNHYGEVRRFRLPNVGLQIQYSTRYWLNYPGSDPLNLEPDMTTGVTLDDLLAGRDPALESALGLLSDRKG
jgi:C-terminal processing protease CtpA/Prc